MSYGIVICSICFREVHQIGPQNSIEKGWRHCEDKTPRCKGAQSVYPKDKSQIKGKWCGMDDHPELEGMF